MTGDCGHEDFVELPRWLFPLVATCVVAGCLLALLSGRWLEVAVVAGWFGTIWLHDAWRARRAGRSGEC